MRLLTFENTPGVDAAITENVRKVGPVAHEAAGINEVSVPIGRRNAITLCQCDELITPRDSNESLKKFVIACVGFRTRQQFPKVSVHHLHGEERGSLQYACTHW